MIYPNEILNRQLLLKESSPSKVATCSLAQGFTLIDYSEYDIALLSRLLERMNVPEDADEFTDGLVAILIRISGRVEASEASPKDVRVPKAGGETE